MNPIQEQKFNNGDFVKCSKCNWVGQYPETGFMILSNSTFELGYCLKCKNPNLLLTNSILSKFVYIYREFIKNIKTLYLGYYN